MATPWWENVDSEDEQDIELLELEAEALSLEAKKKEPPAPKKEEEPKDPGFFSEFTLGKIGKRYADLFTGAKGVLEDIYQSPNVQNAPSGTAGNAALAEAGMRLLKSTGKAASGLATKLANDPSEGLQDIATGALQTAVGAAFPPAAPVTVPLVGRVSDTAIDHIQGDEKTWAERGKEAADAVAFEALPAMIPYIKPGSKAAKAQAIKLKNKTKKLFTEEGDYLFEQGERLNKPGRVSSSLGAVDKNKAELAVSKEMLEAEKTLIDEKILQDTDFAGKTDVAIADELTERISSRIDEYQQVERQLLDKADELGAVVDIDSLVDESLLKKILGVDEAGKVGGIGLEQFPVLSEIYRNKSRLSKAAPLSATQANQALKELQKYVRVVGGYDSKKLAPSALQALNDDFALAEAKKAAGALNDGIDAAVSSKVDLTTIEATNPELVKPFKDVNKAQHDLLTYKDVPGEFKTKRLGTESGDRINVTEPKGMNPRIGTPGSVVVNAQEAGAALTKRDMANLKARKIQKDTIRMLEDAKLSAQYQGGQKPVPGLRSDEVMAEAAAAMPAAGELSGKIGIGAAGASAVDSLTTPPEGIDPAAATDLLSKLNPFTATPAEAQETPMPGVGSIPTLQQAMPAPALIPRDPDIIAANQEHIRTLMLALSPNAAQLMVDALENKDPIKRRLAFSVALQEAPELFEPSVTGARSEIRVGDGFVLGDANEIPLIKARLTSRFRRGEIPSDKFAEQVSALNDPTDQRLFPEPPYPSMDEELKRAMPRASSPQEALSRATPRTIKTPAGERRIYEEGASGNMGKSSGTFEDALNFVEGIEGGLNTNPNDRGNKLGPTNMGVTQATYNAWRDMKGLPRQSTKKLTREESRELYKSMFWDDPGIESLPEAYRTMVFDVAVNSGPSKAIKLLQGALGVATDGRIGPDTIAAAAKADPDTVIKDFIDLRRGHYKKLAKNDPTQQDFLSGWLDRADKLEKMLLA